jgi:hypothetical protein
VEGSKLKNNQINQHLQPMSSLEALFCDVDDFCQAFEPKWHSKLLFGGTKSRQRGKSLTLSETMTILIAFHQNHYRNFKHYYLDHVCIYWGKEFPRLPSYQRESGMDTLDLDPFVHLFIALFWSL